MQIFLVAEGGRGENWHQKVLIYEAKLTLFEILTDFFVHLIVIPANIMYLYA